MPGSIVVASVLRSFPVPTEEPNDYDDNNKQTNNARRYCNCTFLLSREGGTRLVSTPVLAPGFHISLVACFRDRYGLRSAFWIFRPNSELFISMVFEEEEGFWLKHTLLNCPSGFGIPYRLIAR
jgi:hypothetical protein